MTSPSAVASGGSPVVSVVIACRNAADTLATQLDALTAQESFVPWEVILCDNGSQDESRSIAQRYVSRLPRLAIVDAPECRGAGQVRNAGVARAEGQWIAFCDADDEVAPGWLVALSHALAQHRFVAGRLEGNRLNDAEALRIRDVPQASGLQMEGYGVSLPHAGAGNMGIHRDLFLALGGFDPHLRWYEDPDLCYRAQLSGVELVFVPDALVHVRLRPTFSGGVRQGWEYGRAHATLEERYSRLGAQQTATEVAGSRHRAGLTRRVRGLVANPRGSAWRIGYRLGRRAQRLDGTSPLLVGPPQLVTPSMGEDRPADADGHTPEYGAA